MLEQVGAAAFSRAVQAYDTLERRLVCLKVVKVRERSPRSVRVGLGALVSRLEALEEEVRWGQGQGGMGVAVLHCRVHVGTATVGR